MPVFDLEKQVKVKEYNIRNDAIRWQILKSTNVILLHFRATSYRFQAIDI